MQTIEIKLGDTQPMVVHQVDVTEGVSRLFEIRAVVRTADAALDLEPLLGQDASLTIASELVVGRRQYRGIIERAEQGRPVTGGAGTELTEYHFSFVPRMWLATQRVRHRVFQHRTAPQIIEEVLKPYGSVELRVDAASHPRLEYRVQYGESDFDFAHRIMEEAGISYALLGDDTSTLTFGDALSESPLRQHDALTFDPTEMVQLARPRVRDFSLVAAHRPRSFVASDYDFRNPTLSLAPEGTGEGSAMQEQEVHVYQPGRAVVERDASGSSATPTADDKGTARTDRAYADQRSKRYAEAQRSGRLEAHFESNQIELSAGSVVKVEQHPHPLLGKNLLVTRTEIHALAPSTLRVRHVAASTGEPFRTPMTTPRPRIFGVQSARVVGPANEEIHVDEHGRVRVYFPWDRDGSPDDRSSCWIRVADGWAGVGFGQIAIPRVGQEVLVAFLEGDPDSPVVVGRMYNTVQPVPYKLPDNKTVTALRTQSSPANGGYNELKLEDKAQKEFIYWRAQRDRHELVLRDQRTRIERKHHATTVNDEHRVTKEVKRELVLKESHLHVVADRREKYDAKQAVTVGSDCEIKVGSKYAVEAGNHIHLKAGSTLVIEAGARLTLKGPGGFVDIHGGGVDIVGELVRINSGGSAGSGEGCAPQAPDDAEEATPMDTSVE